jgi:hypothetical protein
VRCERNLLDNKRAGDRIQLIDRSKAMSSRAGIATGRSVDLTIAGHATQVGEVLRSEPDWHIAQDDTGVMHFPNCGRVR